MEGNTEPGTEGNERSERGRDDSERGTERGSGETGHGRRTFLALASAAGVAALSGCSSAVSTASAAQRPPSVPEERLSDGGWEQVDAVTQDPAFEQQVGPMSVTAATQTLLYEDAELRADIESKTLGQASGQFGTFFATRVTFDPDLTSLPAGAGRQQLLDQVESQSRSQFESRLQSAGLDPVERAGTGTLEVASGASARLTDYEASYSFEGFSANMGAEELGIEGGEIAVAGHLAAWIANDSVLVSGGAYPAENFARSATQSPSEAIEVSVDIDLGLTPDAYREELFGLVRRVE